MRYVAVVSAVLVSGCAVDWTRPGASPEQARQDYAECDISAAGKYPMNMEHYAVLRDQETQYCMRQKAIGVT